MDDRPVNKSASPSGGVHQPAPRDQRAGNGSHQQDRDDPVGGVDADLVRQGAEDLRRQEDGVGCTITNSNPPSDPMIQVLRTVATTGWELVTNSSAPAAMPLPPSQKTRPRPSRAATQSPERPAPIIPRAKALAWKPATV